MRTKRTKIIVAALSLAALFVVAPNAMGSGQGINLSVTEFALSSGIFNSVFAKELCSCHFVDELSREDCTANDNLPGIAHKLVTVEVDENAKTVRSAYIAHDAILAIARTIGINHDFLVGGSATAQLDQEHPEFGCVLTHLPSDN